MKKIKILFSFIFLATMIIGCSGNNGKVSNDAFVKSMSSGLEERWQYTDQNNSNVEKAIDLELTKLIDYKDKEFEDQKLQKTALAYISTLEKSRDLIVKKGENAMTSQEWGDLYNDRLSLIKNMVDNYKLTVSKDNQDVMNQFLSEAEVKEEVSKMINKANFKAEKPEYSGSTYLTYSAKVKNTSKSNFSSFTFQINLVDKKGVVVGSQSAYAQNWKSGTVYTFEFSTDKKFKDMDIRAQWYV